MAGTVSLEGSIRTCKIDTAYANKVQSDRFLNPCNMVCPVWNGFDAAGRPACPDSFDTKSAGCNSAEDRVFVENYQRPQYMSYVNLSAGGIDGEFYGGDFPCNTMSQWNRMKAVSDLNDARAISGNFGLQLSSNIAPTCGIRNYALAMSQNAEALRKYSGLENQYASRCYKLNAGM